MATMPIQIRPRHTPCASVNSSPKNATAKMSDIVGLTYCRNPIIVMLMRFAAAEYSSSGTAVATPLPTSSTTKSVGSCTAMALGTAGVSCQTHGNTAPAAKIAQPSTPVSSDSNAMPGNAG